jgi:hypothetical protein
LLELGASPSPPSFRGARRASPESITTGRCVRHASSSISLQQHSPGSMDSGLIASRCPGMTTERVFLFLSTSQPASDVTSHSRGALRPGDAIDRPFETVERAQGMPGEGLTHGPPAEKNAGGRYHRCSRSTGIPRALVLTLIRDRPGDRLDCPRRRQQRVSVVASLASAPGGQAHTISRPHRCRSSA